MKKIHEKFMRICLNLAKKGEGKTLPNPLVGCVIVKNGEIIGKGYHKQYGKNHAEVEAIKNSQKEVKNSTLYVNLEPCSHFGKTPPCVDLIIEKKIKRVVIGTIDPNPLVSGKGIKKLKEHGIEVITGILENECRKLNEVFFKNVLKKEAFMILKLASTLDGKIAESSKKSKWITNEKARKYVHKLRYSVSGICIGANTLRYDNPDLNARKKDNVIKKLKKIVLTRSFNFPLDLKIFSDKENLLFLTPKNSNIPKEFQTYNVLKFENPKEIPKILYENEIYSVIVEGGAKVSYFFLKNRLIDKIYFFYANKILGGKYSISMIEGDEEFGLENPLIIDELKLKKVNENFLVIGYPKYLERDVRC